MPNNELQATSSAEAVLHQKIMHLVGVYIADVNTTKPLAEQGLDSLAALELRQKLHEILGVELTSLIEDPQGATVAAITREAAALLASTVSLDQPSLKGLLQPPPAKQVHLHQQPPLDHEVHVDTFSTMSNASLQRNKGHVMPWISPAPVSVKMRLFCIPYAGGVSENVFAR